jgi:HAD superfamily hydrolase (TIGR01509 family)
MKYKAVIFDMDGLIADTEIIESRSFEKLLKEYGIKPKFHENGLINQVGMAGDAYYNYFKERHNLNEDNKILREKKRAFFKQIVEKEGITPFPGFIDLLNLLKKEKFKIALASNRTESFIFIILEAIGVKSFFEIITGPSNERRYKPHPDIYLHTAKELGVHPEDCIVFEDSETGIASAKNAGMKVIAVPNIYTKNHDFSKADIIVKSLLDVDIKLLQSL